MSSKYFNSRSICPVCDSENGHVIKELDYSDNEISAYLKEFYESQGSIDLSRLKNAKYALIHCQECNLIYQKEIPNDELMKTLYDEWIDPEWVYKNVEQQHDLNYYIKYGLDVASIVAYFNEIPSKLNFLDFGMGWGKWLLMAKSYGVNVFGMELSEFRIDIARKNGIEIIPLDESREGKFDFINADQVFEHIPDPKNILGKLSGFLSDKGLIRISVPNGWDALRVIRKSDWQSQKGGPDSMNVVAPLEHINCFTNQSLVRLGAEVGLKNIQSPGVYFLKSSSQAKQTPKDVLKFNYRYLRDLFGFNQAKKNVIPSTDLFFQKC